MSVDPNDKNCIKRWKEVKELGLKLKLLPMYQNFNPTNHNSLPSLKKRKNELAYTFHMGTTYTKSKLKYITILIEVAHDFPNLKMIIAHLGHPWEEETIILIRKQPNIYSDISALYYRQAILQLIEASKEYGYSTNCFKIDYPNNRWHN